jgi:predicted ribosome quality control (RQC) complex YloA/Tae2 family protein
LQNIYDINSKTFLFKFNPKEGDEKQKIIIESGVRIHKTIYDFDSGNVQPSFFAMKLRKFLRDRRCTGFSQVGFDRLVHFEFGHPNPAMIYHLYVEFFSLGNIILTDGDRKVLQVLRVVKSDVASISLENGSYYKQSNNLLTLGDHFNKLESLITDPMTNIQLKRLIKEQFGVFSTAMLGHVMNQTSCSDFSKDFICRILDQFKFDLIECIVKPRGYLTFEMQGEERMYCDFHSFKFAHLNSEMIIAFDSFNDALDEFYSKIEYQKTQKSIQQQEFEAQSKIAAIGAEQQNRIKGLENLIDLHLFRALAIEANIKLVKDVILIIKAAIESGMDWSTLEHLITEEKKKGRDTASVIEKLKLERNLVVLSLESSDGRIVLVDIDINLSPHANSTHYYDLRKAAIVKLDRSKEAFEMVLFYMNNKFKHYFLGIEIGRKENSGRFESFSEQS